MNCTIPQFTVTFSCQAIFMASKGLSIFLVMVWAQVQIFHLQAYSKSTSSNVVNVVHFGAVGNGKTDDTQAFLKAWANVCGMAASSTLYVPQGKTFLIKPVTFHGPCKSITVTIQIDGNLVAPTGIWNLNYNSESWILFDSIYGLSVVGSGSIDGQGSPWWNCIESKKCYSRPSGLKFNFCNKLNLNGLKINNSPGMHVVLHNCRSLSVSGLTISAPEDSPNTDGIHLQYCKNAEIRNSVIGTGDDCISIGNGSSNITIDGIHCGPGHGISVGSLGSSYSYAAVEQISVSNCVFDKTMNGARIKTWQGGSGYARAITYQGLKMNNVDNPIVIDQYYCNGNDGCANHTSAVKVSDVSFVNIYGSTSNEVAINLACSKTVGCRDINLKNVQFTTVDEAKKALSYCLNVKGKSIPPVVPAVPCLDPKY